MVTLDQAGWNRGMLLMLPPPAPLSTFIEYLWIDERPHRSPKCHEWRIVADDAAHIIYARFADHDGTQYHRLHVVGARTLYADVDCSRRLLTAGARLRPGVLSALFRVSARELTNRSVPVDTLVRDAAHTTLARLHDSSASDTTSHLASFIGNLGAHSRGLDDRAARLHTLTLGAGGTVHDVAQALGMGDRALRSWSVAHLGLGLRRFLRIRRLHDALERRLRHPTLTWSTIAAASGFADQSHFVRDCRALLGESPGEFFARAS